MIIVKDGDRPVMGRMPIPFSLNFNQVEVGSSHETTH
jgi:hypothetical protein